MPLQIQYSKQIARELGKIAVYFPGDEIHIGDIIKFPYGKKGLFRKEVPWGTFTRVTSLKNLDVAYDETGLSPDPSSYQFSTKNTVDVNLGVSGEVALGSPELPGAGVDLNIKFTAEGAIYFLAVACQKNSINDIPALEHQIQSKSDLLWDGTFLVTGVTIAEKALIIQSNSRNSEVVVGGEVQALQSGSVSIDANATIGVKKKKGSVFIKDWSDNVTVFIEVMKLEKKVFSRVKSMEGTKGIPSGEQDTLNEVITLKKVNVSEYLEY